jgi:FkbM family methyltransferase
MGFLRNAITATRHPAIGWDYLRWKVATMIGQPRVVNGAFGTQLRTLAFSDLRSTRGFVPGQGELEMIRNLSANHQVFMDIGANFGVWTTALATAHPGAHVYCFEPTPSTFTALSANIALNRLQNVTALQLAVSDSIGTFSFQIARNASYFNRLAPVTSTGDDPRPDRFIGAQTTDVRSVVLDDFCAARGIDRVGFVKIDVEGAELSVLRGARDLLRRRAIELMLIEVDPENLQGLGDSLEGLALAIADAGYTFHSLRVDGSFGPPTDIRSHRSLNMVAKPISM